MMLEDEIKIWCEALRSGKYKQTYGYLQDYDGYCCLGVACEVFIPKDLRETGEFGWLKGSLPSYQPHSPVWLKYINTEFEYHTKSSLAEINDSLDFSFDEIADILEAVYVHKVLD